MRRKVQWYLPWSYDLRRRIHRRRGHAMAMVVVFTTVMSSWYAISAQRAASALRLHHVRALQQSRDTGCMQALAHTLSLLETGFPSTSELIGTVSVDSEGTLRRYTVTIRYDKHRGFSVSVSPTPPGQQVPVLPKILPATKPPK